MKGFIGGRYVCLTLEELRKKDGKIGEAFIERSLWLMKSVYESHQKDISTVSKKVFFHFFNSFKDKSKVEYLKNKSKVEYLKDEKKVE